jgi:type II secretory ATPase GspE/PulE/Tfp pilus assembly ATPase PilB-like protein
MIGDPTLVTATTNIIIAQRLVRKICPNCKKEYQPNAYETHEINEIMANMPEEIKPKDSLKFFRGEGCDKCFHVGFSGRIGIFEILHLDSGMQKLISTGAPISDLQETARKAGMITMEEDGLLKALEGVTTIGDVLKTVRE